MYITGVAKAGGLGGLALLTKSFGYWKDRQTGVGPHFLGKFLPRKLQKKLPFFASAMFWIFSKILEK